ncbi:MAG: twin-arginine translocase TatA/TatE family subunit [Deltaproteobacteria bacterium]|jgi:sec-independent protein translocase protein TatB|nr:twin-arginine translocase TatA/TatE family subunit [Deltaproteobacteria bacterium]
MFGLSMSEVAVVALVALVALGPDKLPVVMRTLAKGWAALAKLKTEFNKAVAANLAELEPDKKRLGLDKLESQLDKFGPQVEKSLKSLLELPSEAGQDVETPPPKLTPPPPNQGADAGADQTAAAGS